MTQKILIAVTSVRVGDGAAAGSLDLPVARERHTGWPFLPGSSLKGALRARASVLGASDQELTAVFGSSPPAPDAPSEELLPGSLRVTQATLLALPVRSLKSTFALLTCPTALARFGRGRTSCPALPAPRIEDVLVASGSTQRHVTDAADIELGAKVRGVVWLEDLDLVGVRDEAVDGWVRVLGELVADEVPLEHLVVVHDDVFAHACSAWTELRSRNAVGRDGVVEDHLLFDVELLPPETLWWVELFGGASDLLPGDGVLWTVGGHQSVGAGRVTWFGGAA